MGKNEKIKELLNRNVQEVIVKKDLEKKLQSGKKLRIYSGVDPSSPIIHIGHAVGLRKLKEFQDMGHKIIFLIGDFTGRIGDPTDRNAQRVPLTEKETKENAKTYMEQASKILDIKKVDVVYNSKWLSKMTFQEVIELSGNFTVQQMIERDMYKERIKARKPIGLNEFLYPLMQGYDSVVLDVDLEIGGTDQTFNMLAGRTLMKILKNKDKHVITLPLLLGTDGRKMSKSYGNVIGVTDTPDDMFGKIMSIADDLILQYFELCTDRKDLISIKKRLKKDNPRDVKAELARDIVTIYHGKKMAETASKEFDKIFKDKGKPSDMKLKKVKSKKIVDVLAEIKMVSSKSEAKRLIQQGGVKINDKVVKDIDERLEKKRSIIQIGKRRFSEVEK